jgi:hypothetical protein
MTLLFSEEDVATLFILASLYLTVPRLVCDVIAPRERRTVLVGRIANQSAWCKYFSFWYSVHPIKGLASSYFPVVYPDLDSL